ncbi:MAG: peptidylprolyl isomerase, partial [Proteobacteria bacterium]|nr:peptidylprolyl isomerase [Pseudomonadota bacterium]
MFKFKCLCAIVALSAAPAVAAEELSESGEFLDGVAAIVNEGIVLKSQLRDQLAMILRQADTQQIQLPPANVLQDQVLERLILGEVQLQRAARIGLHVSDQMLNQAIERVAQQNDVRLEDMPALLAKDGINYADFRRDLRDEITLEQLRRIDVGQRINVSPREIEQCIADLEDNVVVNSDYSLSHILVSLPEAASAEHIEEVRAKLDDIYQQIMDGADFRAMAIRYSEGPTALEGGALGWMPGEQVPTLFIDVIATLEAGEISKPFRSASSFHLVKVNELRSALQRSEINQVKARHILVTPNEIIDDATAQQRLDDALTRIKDGEDFAELAKLLSDDPGSAVVGGDLGWAEAGSFVPEFEAMLNSMAIGDISEPFRSPFGWHIIEVLDRRVYDNTEDEKQRRCDLRIRNDKMEEETQLWMRRLRDEAYVD